MDPERGRRAALGIKTFGQLVTPGLSWRTEFLRQFVFAFQVTLVPASIVAFVVGFSTIGIQGGSLASAFGAIDRDLRRSRRSPSCASSARC